MIINSLSLLYFSLIEREEAGHALALGEAFDGEAVGLHHGAVVLLMGTAQFGGHGHLVVEVGQRAVGIEGAGVEDGLRDLPGVIAVGLADEADGIGQQDMSLYFLCFVFTLRILYL